MRNYRILEKKGEYKNRKETIYHRCYKGHIGITSDWQCRCCEEIKEYEEYIPRYIVQVIACTNFEQNEASEFSTCWRDLKEFNNLEEARKFKRDLELDDGIVIE